MPVEYSDAASELRPLALTSALLPFRKLPDRHLPHIQFLVQSPFTRHQFIVIARLHDHAGIEHHHTVEAALAAHATQVALEGDTVLVGDGARQPVVGVEFYRLVAGAPAGPRDAEGRETDLFAGV